MDKCEDYQRFFEQCPVGLYKTRQEDGLFVEINPFGAKLLGYNSPEEVIGKVYSTEFYDKNLRNDLKDMLYDDGAITDFEIQLKQKNGNNVWVSATAMNGDNFIIGSLTDITERKEMENQIETLKLNQVSVLKQISEDVRQRCKALDKKAI